MLGVRISAAAEADLQSHAEFGIERFGTDQAWSYQEKLIETFQFLARFPRVGRRVGSTMYPECLLFGFGSHLVIYTFDAHSVVNRRILHASVDLDRHI